MKLCRFCGWTSSYRGGHVSIDGVWHQQQVHITFLILAVFVFFFLVGLSYTAPAIGRIDTVDRRVLCTAFGRDGVFGSHALYYGTVFALCTRLGSNNAVITVRSGNILEVNYLQKEKKRKNVDVHMQ